MNKLSLNLKIPFAINSSPVINPQNGYKYTKRITQEFKDFQTYCKDNSIFYNSKDEKNESLPVEGEVIYKDIWLNVNPAYVKREIIFEVINKAYLCVENQTSTKHSFE